MNNKFQQKKMVVAVAAGLSLNFMPAVGMSAVISGPSTTIYEFGMSGNFSWLDSNGAILSNTGMAKGVNGFLTPVSGTLVLEMTSGVVSGGGLSIAPFWFLGNSPGEDYDLHDSSIVGIGDGMGGSGPLLLGNMLFDWNGNSNIPLSIVWDASGVLGAIGSGISVGGIVSGVGASPSVDGTYSSPTFGYIAQGPTPLATTDWNITPLCSTASPGDGSCLGANPSGSLPLIADIAPNANRYDLSTSTYEDLLGDGTGIGGNPMIDGPFTGLNFNFDINTLTLQSVIIVDNVVPIPAALWLFGSGLAILVTVSKRKR